MAESRNARATKYNVFFLPNASDGLDPNKDPRTVPIDAIEIVRPCSNTFSCQNF